MSWCGRCFTVQTTSDFESEDDGEYEYFVNSRYICKRRKSVDSAVQKGKVPVAESSMSHTGEPGMPGSSSQNCSSSRSRSKVRPGCCREQDCSQCDASDKKSSLSSSQLDNAQVWQVGHATLSDTKQYVQPFFDTSTSDSDRTLEIVFDAPRREAESPSQARHSPDHPELVHRACSIATTATSMVTIDHSPCATPRKGPGFIQRLFGRSAKSPSSNRTDILAFQSSLFKESMELPSPAETTKTLHWTVRVKLK